MRCVRRLRVVSARVGTVAVTIGVVLALAGGVGLAAFTSTASGATGFATRDLLPPTGLVGTPSCGGTPSVTLGWTAGSSWADAQEVWRSTTAGSAGLRLATTAASDVSYADATVEAGITYYYRVTSVKVGWSEVSAEASAAC